MTDVTGIVQRALLRRGYVSREEIRTLALAYRDVAADLERETARTAEAHKLSLTTLADAELLKQEVEELRQLVTLLRKANDDTVNEISAARTEVARSKAVIDGQQEWRIRALRVVTAAREWQRNPRSDRALTGLKDAVRDYGAEA